jgi:hypothetical protein
VPPSAGFVRQHSDAYFAERQKRMGTTAPAKNRATARDACKDDSRFFFLRGGFQLTAHHRHWKEQRRKDNVIPNGNIRPGQNYDQ